MSEPLAIDLKPCPFCGGEADIDAFGLTQVRIGTDGIIWGEIQCAACGAMMREADGNADGFFLKALKDGDEWTFSAYELMRVRDVVTAAWNRRTP